MKDPTFQLTGGAELTETMLNRTPKVLGVVAIGLAGLIFAALIWSYCTEVDVIVAAPMRIRPLESPGMEFGQVSGEEVKAEIDGKVVAVNFKVWDEVKEGDTLIVLDSEKLRNELARIESQMDSLTKEIESLKNINDTIEKEGEESIKKAGIELEEARAIAQSEAEKFSHNEEQRAADEKIAVLEVAKQQREYESKKVQVEKELLARMELARAEESLREAQARLEKSRIRPSDSQVRAAEIRVNSVQSTIEILTRQYESKAKEVEAKIDGRKGEINSLSKSIANVRLDIARCTIRARLSGVVTDGEVQLGSYVSAGRTLLSIARQSGFRVDAMVSSSEIGSVKPGMKGNIKVDTFDFQKFGTLEGTIESVSPDSKATEGGKLCYTVKMTIANPQFKSGERIRFGLTGRTEIVVRKERLLFSIIADLKSLVDPG